MGLERIGKIKLSDMQFCFFFAVDDLKYGKYKLQLRLPAKVAHMMASVCKVFVKLFQTAFKKNG